MMSASKWRAGASSANACRFASALTGSLSPYGLSSSMTCNGSRRGASSKSLMFSDVISLKLCRELFRRQRLTNAYPECKSLRRAKSKQPGSAQPTSEVAAGTQRTIKTGLTPCVLRRPLRLDSLYQCRVVCFRIGCLGGIISGVINIESKQAIESLCPEVGEEIIQDFFARMDDDYFATFSPEEISTHIRMSCALDPEHPAQCRITPRGEDEFDIIIVGLDYLSEFSIFCGLLSAFG